MSDGKFVVYTGSYANSTDARVDFDAVKTFYAEGSIGKYEAALFAKQADGSVDIIDTETPRRSHGAAWGAATGALVGIVFPVTLLVGSPVLAAAAGGALVANWSKMFGRDDIRKLGETLDQGETGVVVLAEVHDSLPVSRVLSHAGSVSEMEISDEKALHDMLKEE